MGIFFCKKRFGVTEDEGKSCLDFGRDELEGSLGMVLFFKI